MPKSNRKWPPNPVVDRFHEIRRKMAEECNYDVHEYFRMIREFETTSGHRLGASKKGGSPKKGSARGALAKPPPLPPSPVVDRVRQVRRDLAEECNYDLKVMGRKIRDLEKARKANLASPPKTAARRKGPIARELRRMKSSGR